MSYNVLMQNLAVCEGQQVNKRTHLTFIQEWKEKGNA